jgi:hypothetical protein
VWTGQLSRYSDQLGAGRSGDRIPVEARFSAPVQTGPGPHPAPCTMGTGSFPGVESSRAVKLTPHPLLFPWSKEQSRAAPLLSLRVFMACKKTETYRIQYCLANKYLSVDIHMLETPAQGWTYRKTKFCTVAPNTCGYSVRNFMPTSFLGES